MRIFVRLPPFGKDYNFFLQCERENRSLWEAGKPYRDKNGEGPARTGTLERRGKEVSAYSGKRT